MGLNYVDATHNAPCVSTRRYITYALNIVGHSDDKWQVCACAHA